MQVKQRPVVSSMIRSVGYDEGASLLEIEFQSGKVYRYHGVKESVYRGFISADSKGHYFEMHIKDAQYGYERVT
jgi:hypothetical protein